MSSFKVAVNTRFRNTKHTKNGIFCVKVSHWNSDTSFSQSVQYCEANRAWTSLEKIPKQILCLCNVLLFRATPKRYSWLDLKITACENANNNLCNFKWVSARCFDAFSLNIPLHIWLLSMSFSLPYFSYGHCKKSTVPVLLSKPALVRHRGSAQ